MDPRIQRRIALFYLGGVINVFLGCYVLIEGSQFLSREKTMWLVIFFFAFAAVDFWFPHAIRKKLQQQESQRDGRAPGPVTGDRARE